ncbi:type I-E CRISPR-associated protein Cse1/CasA [Nocardia sp. NPDC057663]|uniref:type I-E CRISPR-associated protein Cse1/CasA n=1 Tax=Nocardia sp. NPDC057663 TaxID=3346201 RepID=UPI00366DD2D2
MTTATAGLNLVDDHWIQVVDRTAKVELLSVRELLRRAADLSSIVGEIPTQSFAILRLLTAILRRSIAGRTSAPVDVWSQLWESPQLPQEEIDTYLDTHRSRFELFDAHAPFYQVAGLKAAGDAVGALDKLIGDVPNGAKYFTTRAGRHLQQIDFDEAARWLVHAQGFDPSGIKTGAIGDPRVRNNKGYPIGIGFAGALGGVFLEGATLRETLLLNLVLLDINGQRYRGDDLPVWEREPDGPGVRTDPLPTGPADLATWQSRRIRLVATGSHVTGVVLCNGDPLEPFNQHLLEPMSGWRYSDIQTKKAGGPTRHYPRTHDPERSLWRGMSAMLNDLATSTPSVGNDITAGVLHWAQNLVVDDVLDRTHPVRLHAVGMHYINQQSVVGEVVNDTIGFRVGLLSDPALRSIAIRAVDSAENAVSALAGFTANLTRAAGGEPDGPRARIREEAYFALEEPFRRWLADLNPRKDTFDDELRTWHRLVRPLVDQLAADALHAAGNPAWVGRPADNRWLDSGLSQLIYRAQLRKAVPGAFATTDDDGGRPRMTSIQQGPTTEYGALEEWVHVGISRRQTAYIKRESDALAAMAKLRRGIGAPPGRMPELWGFTLKDLPEASKNLSDRGVVRATEEPTAWELSCYDAMTMHALHQQSHSQPMHRRDYRSVGAAVRRLGVGAEAEDVVRSRFHVIGTATDHDTRLTHLRGLIGQLRAHAIPVDYARLAVDLCKLDTGRYADQVLLSWGRDYHRNPPSTTTSSTSETGDNQ